MSFPASLTTRTVKGRFVTYPDGIAAKGSVRIVLAETMQGPTDDVFVVPFDKTFPLDTNGAFSVVLPATDDPQWTPSYYRVTITTETTPTSYRTKGVDKLQIVKLQVPYNATTPIDLTDVMNIPALTPGEAYVVLASKGAPGGVATLGSDGKVTPSQLPAGSGGGGTVTWDDVEDKPSVFPHAAISFSDLTDKPSVYPANPTDWTNVTNKPSVFPAAPVAFSAVTDKPTVYPSSWTEVSGKPVTFTPATHNHATADVSGLDSALAAKASTSDLTTGLATKANSSDLTTGLAGKANSTHSHAQTDITGLGTALSAKADSSAVTTALSTKADLVAGVIPTSQLPAIAVIDFLGSVSTQAAMLALTGQKGDFAIRSDLGQEWIITGSDPTQLASWTAMPTGTSAVQTVNGQTGTVVLGKTDVGLGSADNTSDANKPVSTAQATALALKAPIASPTFTGTVSGVTAAMVGLGNLDNTSDANKPVSTAQATALALKATLASPTFTGIPLAPTAAAATNTTQLATTAFVTTADNLKANLASPTFTGTPAAPTAAAGTSTTQLATTAFVTTADNLKAPLASPTFTGTVAGITATMVGLGSVNNTADTAKPVSTAQQTALDLKANLASPALTGTPTAPTAAAGTNTTQVATTAFVQAYTVKGIVLSAAAAVPGGTPTGTLIYRTAT